MIQPGGHATTGMFTNTLVTAGPEGVDRLHAKMNMRPSRRAMWKRCCDDATDGDAAGDLR